MRLDKRGRSGRKRAMRLIIRDVRFWGPDKMGKEGYYRQEGLFDKGEGKGVCVVRNRTRIWTSFTLSFDFTDFLARCFHLYLSTERDKRKNRMPS